MKPFRNLPAVILAVLLGTCALLYFSTRDADKGAALRTKPAGDQPLVDTSRLKVAMSLAALAATPDEQAQAREAWRLADHEVDLAFASALREAEAESEPAAPAAGPLRALRDRIAALKDKVDTEKKRVEQLGKDGGDDLDRAQAQLDLDQDELDDARQDLAREGGDKRAKLQRLLEEHEATEKNSGQSIQFAKPGPVGTMSEQVREWLALGSYASGLETAGEQAASYANAITAQHGSLEGQLPQQPDAAASVDRLRQLSARHKVLAVLDQRIADTRQLAAAYQKWLPLVEARRGGVAHWLWRSLTFIAAILLAAVLLDTAARRTFSQADRRRHQLRLIVRTSVQIASAAAILLVIFGPPTQVTTMIGLVTAGLTVVMKDFIVAFFGWFTLMGKNGIGVGDWVEIEGVSGEVIEIGLLKTVLLELGNWTETGHPTGRRVAFSNSFAMERHYFNFSTSGQWLWDELVATLPATGDPYEIARKIQEVVERETREDGEEAAKDWQRAHAGSGKRDFSSAPFVNLRPGLAGLDMVVRYITRAPRRNAVKAKIFQEIVEMIRKPA